MSLLCVPILAGDPDAALADARLACGAGADLVEFRIDHLFHGEGDEQGERDVLRLVRETPLPCIVTCRSTDEGGDYDGDDAARISLYERLGALASGPGEQPPRYIDMELSTLTRSANLRQKVRLAVRHDDQPRDLATSLILSTHDFKGRPPDLMQRLEKMRAEPAAKILKVAFMARSVRDNLELFDLLAERDRPTIALAMGPSGLMSRVLAPKFGGFLTFASLRPTTTTAPGQPTVEELLQLYRFRSIRPRSRVYGVIGWPVEHSLSPLVHNAAFDALTGTDALDASSVYLPLPVAPEWEAFKATLIALTEHPRLDFTGASVTIPHKEHLLRFARENRGSGWTIDPSAARVGAANTLARTSAPDAPPAWTVANTDMGAVVACVRAALSGADLSGVRIVVIGAGGVARAAVAGLVDAGASVIVCARDLAKAQALAAASDGRASAAWENRHDPAADVFVNCTPLGMSSASEESTRLGSALDPDRMGELRRDAIVFDTVYTPLETPLLRAAKARGLTTVDGADLFVRQAEAQLELWTGRRPPEGLYERLVRARLA